MIVVNRSESAHDDLVNIALQLTIESTGSVAAEGIVNELIDCCDRLALLSFASQLGIEAPELGPEVRLFSHDRWVMIFRYTDDGLVVLRIVDGSQEYLSWKLG